MLLAVQNPDAMRGGIELRNNMGMHFADVAMHTFSLNWALPMSGDVHMERFTGAVADCAAPTTILLFLHLLGIRIRTSDIIMISNERMGYGVTCQDLISLCSLIFPTAVPQDARIEVQIWWYFFASLLPLCSMHTETGWDKSFSLYATERLPTQSVMSLSGELCSPFCLH